MKLLVIFIVLNVINVILQTVKSLCTVKCGKTVAAIVNAVAYSLYTVVIIFTVCDLSTFTKALVVGLCNLVGVYVVKAIEEKTRKDKLWKIETTAKVYNCEAITNLLDNAKIGFSVVNTTRDYAVINIYCETQNQSSAVKEILSKFDVKYFVTESKSL